jgi:hypothetical protein
MGPGPNPSPTSRCMNCLYSMWKRGPSGFPAWIRLNPDQMLVSDFRGNPWQFFREIIQQNHWPPGKIRQV